jgi:cyclase
MFRASSAAVVLALALAPVLPAGAQTRKPGTADIVASGLKLSDFPRLAKITDDVYTFEGIHAPGFTTVSLIVVGRDGVLIADGQGTTKEVEQMLAEIRKITPKPVKWYVVGSEHGDHTAGNSALPKDITYVIHPTSRAQMERDAKNPNRRPDAPPVVVPPTAMAGDRQTIDVGGMEVQVLFLGRAHTGGDLNVYLPRQKILFMSEVYLNRLFPAMRSAYPSEWVTTIDKALAMDVQRYIPGHGFIEEPALARQELIEYQKAMKAVIAEVTRLHKMGLSVHDAIKQANWGPYTDWYIRDSQAPIAVRKVYEELEGKLK